MDWNGQNKRQITNNNYRCAYPTWSHDMRYIFFEAYIDGDWELFRINSDGSGQKRLTYNSGGHDWHPSAHPFDTKVIFESGMPGHDDIYIMNYDGSAVSRIFARHERRRTPDLSSDSTKLVYTRYFGDNSEVYYADIRDQNEIRITTNGDWDGHPMFSPDGKLIVYEQRTGGKEDLIIYDIATGQKTNVTNTGHKDSDACFMYQD
jgi:TolB protein